MFTNVADDIRARLYEKNMFFPGYEKKPITLLSWFSIPYVKREPRVCHPCFRYSYSSFAKLIPDNWIRDGGGGGRIKREFTKFYYNELFAASRRVRRVFRENIEIPRGSVTDGIAITRPAYGCGTRFPDIVI